jgi:TP901 family phage tail tape measure protein
MALPESGVRLIVEGQQNFFRTLGKADKGIADLGSRSTASAGRGFSALEQVGIGALRRIGAAAVEAGAMLAKSLGAALVDSINVAADFEAQMSGIGAVLQLDTASQEFEALNDLALELGSSTSFSATQAASALEMLAKNGLAVEEILNGAAEATVSLAAATGGELSDSADIMTDAMAIFEDSIESASEAVDGITGVTVASKFTLNDYKLAIGMAGSVAASAGISFDEFNQTIAVISSSFAGGSQAGTSFKTFLQSIVPKSKDAEATMMELGLITADGANQFFTASGELKNMAEVAEILKVALSGLNEEQTTTALRTIFGADASAIAAQLARDGAAAFDEMAEAIGSVDAAEQAAARLDNFRGAMEQAKGAAETLKIVVGTALLPILSQFLNEVVTPGINQLTALARALQESEDPLALLGSLATQAGQDFAGFAQSSVASLQGFGQQLIGWVQSQLPAWSAGLQQLGQQLATWVLENAPTMIANLMEARTQLTAWVLDSLPEWGAQLLQLGQKLGQWVLDALPGLGTNLGKVAALLIEKTAEFLQVVVPKLAALAKEFLIWVGEEVLPNLPQHLAKIQAVLEEAVGNFMKEVGPLLSQLAEQFLAWVQEEVLPTLPGHLQEIWSAISSGVVDMVTGMGKEAPAIGEAFVNGFANAIIGGLGSITAAAQSAAQSAWEAAKSFLEAKSPSRKIYRDVGIPFVQGFTEGILSGIGEAVSAAEYMGEEALQALEGIAGEAEQILRSALDNISGVYRGLSGGISDQRRIQADYDKAKEAGNAAREAWGEARKEADAIAENAAKEIAELEAERAEVARTAAQHFDGDRRVEAAQRLLELDEAIADVRRDAAADEADAVARVEALRQKAAEATREEQAAQRTAGPAMHELEQALSQAEDFAKISPQAAREFLDLRRKQISELYALQQELQNTEAAGTRQRLQREIALIESAQLAELDQFRSSVGQQANDLAGLLDVDGLQIGDGIATGVINGLRDRANELANAIQAAVGRATEQSRSSIARQTGYDVQQAAIATTSNYNTSYGGNSNTVNINGASMTEAQIRSVVMAVLGAQGRRTASNARYN